MSYPEGRGRELSHAAQGAFVIVAILFAALMFAIGVYVGQHSEPEGESGTAVVTTETGEDTETNEVPEPEETTTEATETTETTVAGEEGKLVFETAGCGGCHVLTEAGSSGTIGPNLDDTSFSRDQIEEQVRKGGGAMPPFEGSLSDEQIAAVADYVAAAAGS